jgi:hypothetical protein
MKLTYLDVRDTQVRDLSALRGMPLETLILNRCPVSDISPLQGMPLKHLRLWDTKVTDLRPLAGMALEYLLLKFGVVYEPAGLTALRDTPELTHISDIAKEDWLAGYEIRHSRDWFPAWRGHVRRAGPVNRLIYGEPNTDNDGETVSAEPDNVQVEVNCE